MLKEVVLYHFMGMKTKIAHNLCAEFVWLSKIKSIHTHFTCKNFMEHTGGILINGNMLQI